MEDIIFQVPWCCGEKDCKSQWHLSSYWGGYEDGTYSVDNYTDGDHDTIDQSDLPTNREIQNSWNEYYAYCKETGEDPLNAFYVKSKLEKPTRFRVGINPSVAGPFVSWSSEKKGGKWVHAELNKEAREFLCVKEKPAHRIFLDFPNVKEIRMLISRDTSVKPLTRRNRIPECALPIEFSITQSVQRSEKAVRREVRTRANRALKARKT